MLGEGFAERDYSQLRVRGMGRSGDGTFSQRRSFPRGSGVCGQEAWARGSADEGYLRDGAPGLGGMELDSDVVCEMGNLELPDPLPSRRGWNLRPEAVEYVRQLDAAGVGVGNPAMSVDPVSGAAVGTSQLWCADRRDAVQLSAIQAATIAGK